MNPSSFILLQLVLTFKINLATLFIIDDLLINDCELLRFDLCIKEHSKHTATNLLLALNCVLSNSPNCISIEPATVKSLDKFSQDFCSEPKEKCKLINETIACDTEHKCDNYKFEIAESSIKWLFARTTCIKDINQCPEKKQLNPPTYFKPFEQWYMTVEPMKLRQMIDRCYKFEGEDCVSDTILRMPCLLEENEKTLLKHRFMTDDSNSLLSSYCDEGNDTLRRNFDGTGSNSIIVDLEYAMNEGPFVHDLCSLKDKRAVEFAYSKANCFTRHLDWEGESCFVEKTGGLPSDRSQFADWFCSNQVENAFVSCQPKHRVNCEELVIKRQTWCLPIEKMARKIDIDEILYHRTHWPPSAEYLKCLSIWNKDIVNKCYARIGALPGQVDASKGEKIDEAVCNSNEHFYSFEDDLVKCLKNHDFPEEYIQGCHGILYDINSFIEQANCTFVNYGRAAEECFTQFTKESINSTHQLREWSDKTADSLDRLKLIEACLKKLKSQPEVQIQNKECINEVHMNVSFEESKDFLCSNVSEDIYYERADISSFANFKCTAKHIERGNLDKNTFPPLDLISTYRKFAKWFCGLSREEFVKKYKSVDEFSKFLKPEDREEWTICKYGVNSFEIKRDQICREKHKSNIFYAFSRFFCSVGHMSMDECQGTRKIIEAMHPINSAQNYVDWLCGLEEMEESKFNWCIEFSDASAQCISDVHSFEINREILCNETSLKEETESSKFFCKLVGYNATDQGCAKFISLIQPESTNSSNEHSLCHLLCNETAERTHLKYFCSHIFGFDESDGETCLVSKLEPETKNLPIFKRWICQMEAREFMMVKRCAVKTDESTVNECAKEKLNNLLNS